MDGRAIQERIKTIRIAIRNPRLGSHLQAQDGTLLHSEERS